MDPAARSRISQESLELPCSRTWRRGRRWVPPLRTVFL